MLPSHARLHRPARHRISPSSRPGHLPSSRAAYELPCGRHGISGLCEAQTADGAALPEPPGRRRPGSRVLSCLPDPRRKAAMPTPRKTMRDLLVENEGLRRRLAELEARAGEPDPQRAMRQSASLAEAILASASQGIIVVAQDGRIELAN